MLRLSASAFRLHVEEEVHNVAVLHDVLLSFHSEDALPAGSCLRAVREQIVPADHLRLDESALEVRVDDAGRLRRSGAFADHPGAAFVLPRGEVALQAEEVETGPDELVETRLGEAEVGEELLSLLFGKLLDLRLDLAADGYGPRAFRLGEGLHL